MWDDPPQEWVASTGGSPDRRCMAEGRIFNLHLLAWPSLLSPADLACCYCCCRFHFGRGRSTGFFFTMSGALGDQQDSLEKTCEGLSSLLKASKSAYPQRLLGKINITKSSPSFQTLQEGLHSGNAESLWASGWPTQCLSANLCGRSRLSPKCQPHTAHLDFPFSQDILFHYSKMGLTCTVSCFVYVVAR